MSRNKYATREEFIHSARQTSLRQWKKYRKETGTSLGYYGGHRRVRTHRGPAKYKLCIKCGIQAHDWALIHGKSWEDINNYQPMCHRCHFIYDKVIERINANLTHESRSEAAKLMWQRRSPERRSEIVRKSWVKRRVSS